LMPEKMKDQREELEVKSQLPTIAWKQSVFELPFRGQEKSVGQTTGTTGYK
jgi:hypothetical protein